ncbi:MAG: CRISPR-associated endonuclease Cas2 [Bacteroidota bacterium]
MKKCYIISFDLKPNRNYNNFHEAVKAYGTWARITESTYSVVTESSATDIRDYLIQFLNPDERIFVIKSGGRAAWRSAISDLEWLKKHLPLI